MKAGTLVPQSSIMELKSRSTRATMDWKAVWPQVFFSGTQTTMLGLHERGKFVTMEKKTLDEMEEYAEEAKVGLGQLVQALKQIKAVVISRGRGPGVALIFRNGENSYIEVYEKDNNDPAISPELRSRFENSDSVW